MIMVNFQEEKVGKCFKAVLGMISGTVFGAFNGSFVDVIFRTGLHASELGTLSGAVICGISAGILFSFEQGEYIGHESGSSAFRGNCRRGFGNVHGSVFPDRIP